MKRLLRKHEAKRKSFSCAVEARFTGRSPASFLMRDSALHSKKS
jgi:hypothetical protein